MWKAISAWYLGRSVATAKMYWAPVCLQAVRGAAIWGREQVLGAILVFAILLCQIHFGVIARDGVRGSWLSVILPYIALFSAAYLFHALRAIRDIHTKQCALIDARTEQIRALAQKGNEVETFAAFDLLANQAESVLRALRLTKLVLDPDLDGAEMDVVSYPLKTLRKLLWDGIEWRDAHRAIYIFQYAYMRHREDVIMCRAHCPRTIAFDSEVTKT
ncbi:MAG: hypothetical protein ABSG87_11035, partial [Verrucomicrobiota bacterium]